MLVVCVRSAKGLTEFQAYSMETQLYSFRGSIGSHSSKPRFDFNKELPQNYSASIFHEPVKPSANLRYGSCQLGKV